LGLDRKILINLYFSFPGFILRGTRLQIYKFL